MSEKPQRHPLMPQPVHTVRRPRQQALKLEPEIWAALADLARHEGVSVAAIMKRIDDERGSRPLAASVRVFVLGYYREAAGLGVVPAVH